MEYVLALDQGTTSSRAILYDRDATIRSIAQRELPQIYPRTGWVEHNPEEIWASQMSVAVEALSQANSRRRDLAALGITNQRETTIVWERKTGKPVHNAIVWQDRRTAPICQRLWEQGLEETTRQKTGLLIDAYFSASKIMWILENVQEFQSPRIRSENLVMFAVLLLLGVALASRALARRQWFEGALVLVWGRYRGDHSSGSRVSVWAHVQAVRVVGGTGDPVDPSSQEQHVSCLYV